ncbi:hypothetical protein Tco_0638648, partial [Tanacetum coccineum]
GKLWAKPAIARSFERRELERYRQPFITDEMDRRVPVPKRVKGSAPCRIL